MKFRTAYKDKIQSPFVTEGPSLTKQSMMQECDINFIINKFQKTGVIEHEKAYKGDYGEFESLDFHTAMTMVAEAESMFETVPSSIRKQFDNDPGRFLEFVQNEENKPEMLQMGLLAPDYIAEEGPSTAPPAPSEPEQSEEKTAD